MTGPGRRTMLGGMVAAALAQPAWSRPPASALADIEQRSGGRLGVFAVDLGTGRPPVHRADERVMLFSTFKAVLAAFTP